MDLRKTSLRLKYSKYARLKSNMYSSSPLSSGGHNKWFSNYSLETSQLPPPPRLHRFRDSALEALVFTHRSTYVDNPYAAPNMPSDPSLVWSSERLEWLGDHVLKTLTADLLNDLFPSAGEGELTNLRDSLINNYVYALVAKRLKLDERLMYSVEGEPSERVLAGLFEAYIGGVYRDLGSERWHILRQWFQEFFEPIALQYKSFFDHWTASQEPRRSRSRTPQGMSGSPYGGSPGRTSTFGEGSPYYASTPPGFESGHGATNQPYPHGSASPQRSESTVELKEWADKQHRRPPDYSYESNGMRGDAIMWKATVSLDGRQIASAWAKTKKEAQHGASRNALAMLRGRHVDQD